MLSALIIIYTYSLHFLFLRIHAFEIFEVIISLDDIFIRKRIVS